ncbi:DUF2071 domain-containing protein [Aliiglaciecola lipolytica]|uniref:DUF2071 domain-containing protein n=1 Tax=Aliiglaciecola lipolytica E3 TaxID=1127673 RepID=K6X6F3_9ALTE|nr:DUF2071 domain-containing protein [Aliiglaciecola lipolytica]GAC16199.1 conserved hypothetical protein [Aliiglaciecola lipolytica E3]
MDSLKFKDYLSERPIPKGIDVLCKLQHFAIITYAVPPERFNGLFPDRFKLDTVQIDGKDKALISVVPFIDVDFTSAVYPFPKFTMGQTNYRIYIIDTETNERCVWFLGTTLDSWTLAIPHFAWKLPWYRGKVTFNCDFDSSKNIYHRYHMITVADWAPAEVELKQIEDKKISLEGFPDTETGLVYLTHPLAGFYHRRDNKLGTYRVWHKALNVTPAQLQYAKFGLLSRLGLVTEKEQQVPHSVLVEPINEFTIYLPPKVLK